MKLIGITGFAGSGKDAVCTAIQSRRPMVVRVAFADALKVECAAAFAADPALFHDPTLKDTATPVLAPTRCVDRAFVHHLGATLSWLDSLRPRTVMQQWGDYRRAQDPDYWTKRLEPIVEAARIAGAAAVIVTDVRFLNEHLWLQMVGGKLWRVVRAGLVPRSGHASEWQLEGVRADLTIRNDYGMDELEARAIAAYDDLVGQARPA
ncbi:MAG: hypothetical protein RJA99_4266 [Pseudomonadota bacterium]|jgi:hypothetical protein